MSRGRTGGEGHQGGQGIFNFNFSFSFGLGAGYSAAVYDTYRQSPWWSTPDHGLWPRGASG